MRPKDRLQARRVIFEIVSQNGGAFRNKVNLFKAFWQSHLAYARGGHGYLSGWPIVRMPMGPGIDDFGDLLADLLRDGLLEVDDVPVGNYSALLFRIPDDAPAVPPMSPAEVEAVGAGLHYAADKSASAVSEMSHHSRAWQTARNGQEMNVYLDLIPADALDAEQEAAERLIDATRDLIPV